MTNQPPVDEALAVMLAKRGDGLCILVRQVHFAEATNNV